MANSFSQLFYHVVFSTKNRIGLIAEEIEARIWSYVGGIARQHDLTALRVGGIEDHLHALVMAKPIIKPCEIPLWLKAESSKWIHLEFPSLSKFAWQDGYGVFSVSKSNVPSVFLYIENQRAHHANQTFEEEYLALLKLHEVDYDERYIFG
jgi:putative transposase